MIWLRFLPIFLLGLYAQTQTGGITGKVVLADQSQSQGLAGVGISVSSPVLPRDRQATSGADGSFRMVGLSPGLYLLKAKHPNFEIAPLQVQVFMGEQLQVQLQALPLAELEMTVRHQQEDFSSSQELASFVKKELFQAIPLGNDYRDLLKLAPGVQVSQDQVRGPSAGGSGQDNVYLFDGVNVTLPMFGTLSAEPSAHDVEYLEVTRGGARAIGFNRAGGVTFNSLSKSGTHRFEGELRVQLQPKSLVNDSKEQGNLLSEEDKTWLIARLGGPLLAERLFFFASFQAPDTRRENRSNLYGEVPDYRSKREESYLKLTWQPLPELKLDASWRHSDRAVRAEGVGTQSDAGSISNGADLEQEIAVIEGFWALSSASSLAWKLNRFDFKTRGRPDHLLESLAAIDGSRHLDLSNLDQMGLFTVPKPNGNPAFDAFVAPLIARYGFLRNGVPEGGGRVGVAEQINDQGFYRESFELAFDHFLQLGEVKHELHFGFQQTEDREELRRASNGWGQVSVIGGLDAAQPSAYFRARFSEGTLPQSLEASLIRSQFQSQNLELNDDLEWGSFRLSLGLLLSRDEWFGQGLAEDEGAVSGYRLAPGHSYRMYLVDWHKQIQPRLGLSWTSEKVGRIFAGWSRYNPAVSSLPRAASWARNLTARTIDAMFDRNGQFLSYAAVGSSSGKFFQEDMDPRTTDEWQLGLNREFGRGWSYRGVFRHKFSHHFWEDTNNNARALFGNTAELRAAPNYIPELESYRAEVGGSSFVIAEIGGSNRYYGIENEVQGSWSKMAVKMSYTWSHYYGNIDQDNTSLDNDQNIFVGSSNLADDAGRQIWDLKYGDLRGDRRHQVKLYGNYLCSWKGNFGLFGFYQSGQPWETWDRFYYGSLIGSSTSDTIRYSEPAGSRRTAAHYQLDLSYTQGLKIGSALEWEGRIEVYNLFNRQTGYNPQPSVHAANYGESRAYWEPRRVQLALALRY